MRHAEEITELISKARDGDKTAESRFVELLYSELRKIAGACLRSECRQLTIQATALVNEAYLRMNGNGPREWRNRQHFLATAANVMRRVLVDYARNRGCEKRGGKLTKVDLDANQAIPAHWAQDVLDIDIALRKLAALDERQAHIVDLKFFAGMTDDDIARMLGICERTVSREWDCARAWLRGELARARGGFARAKSAADMIG